ncbi:putative Pentatricopeptide repeat-containing protein [Abeliophyllum distichum]|uniref:Pentatricopeptide repeat-containing protein n=1 Tax=Abeliophyllum distichum TaxID=126358 RepID=A0ABD1V4L3_9LAMI
MKTRDQLIKLFQACKNGKYFTQLHSLTIKSGLTQDVLFAAQLVDLYSNFSPIQTTRKLFDETPQRNVYIWNSMLKCYCREKQYKETLLLFSRLVSCEKLDWYSIPIALKACSGLKAFEFGEMIHGFAEKNGQTSLNLFVGSGLVELYSKFGKMGDAVRVFEEYFEPDIVLWTTLITGYEQNGSPEEALEIFVRMVVGNAVLPDSITLVSIVSACAQLLKLKAGRSVHGYVMRMGFDGSLSLSNSLLNLYAKTGSVNAAANLFSKMEGKDVISWASMIACFAHNRAAMEALKLFDEMMIRGVEPTSVILISTLQACKATCNLEEGKRIHEIAANKGLESDILVSTALIDMYMNCSSPDEAIEVFKRIPENDAACWSALLCGYVQNGMADKSMGVFCNMLASDIRPDGVVMVKILLSCSELGVLQQTCCIHGFVIKGGFSNNSFVGASLIESYAKCGSVDNAVMVFEGIIDKDVIVWSSMFAGYGYHGRGHDSLEFFDRMVKHSAIRPNNVTFLSILAACSHAGLVKEGIEIFNKMVNDYKLIPDSKHYGIVVDLLGRTGELDKAMQFIDQIPQPVGAHIWGALLGACRIHQNMEMVEVAAKNLLQLDPDHSGYYILLSNVYAVGGKWDNAADVRTLVKEKQLKKVSGQSAIELRDEVHNFIANDRSHPKSELIYGLLMKLEVRMREENNVPNMDDFLHDAEGVS